MGLLPARLADPVSVVLAAARGAGFCTYRHCEKNQTINRSGLAERKVVRPRSGAASSSITLARSQAVGWLFGQTSACEYILRALRARRSARPRMIRAPV